VATAAANPLQLILDSERPDPTCYRPSTISVSRRANARDIASRNRKTALANRIFIPAILATLHDSTCPRHLRDDLAAEAPRNEQVDHFDFPSRFRGLGR
jgi:hypothetical protein